MSQIEKYVVMPNHTAYSLLQSSQALGPAASRTPPPYRGACQPNHSGIRFHAQARDNTATAGHAIYGNACYYDHIIRDQLDYDTIWQYIDENPAKWPHDQFYTSDGEEHP
ncbi:MAG: hypothetical protein ACLUOA_03675 [Gemmiger formicilis]|uniref:hypothetical protein n=1 Tax=Gemmiger formicilis TaxID=745368 RepID=UPI003994B397